MLQKKNDALEEGQAKLDKHILALEERNAVLQERNAALEDRCGETVRLRVPAFFSSCCSVSTTTYVPQTLQFVDFSDAL